MPKNILGSFATQIKTFNLFDNDVTYRLIMGADDQVLCMCWKSDAMRRMPKFLEYVKVVIVLIRLDRWAINWQLQRIYENETFLHHIPFRLNSPDATCQFFFVLFGSDHLMMHLLCGCIPIIFGVGSNSKILKFEP